MKPVEHSKRKHSRYSPSAAHRWVECPGSIQLSAKAPPQGPPGPAAMEGTRAHECLEFIVRRFNGAEVEQQALKTWPAKMVDYCMRSAKIIFDLKPGPSATLFIEERVDLTAVSKDAYGTADYVWVEPWGTLVEIDFKYGVTPVLPRENNEINPQLGFYALGHCYKFDFEFSQVQLCILQPRAWGDDEDPLSTTQVSIAEMRKFETRIKKAIELSKLPEPPLRPSEDACKYCPATSICPALSHQPLAAINVAFDFDTELGPLPPVLSLTPERIAVALDAADLLDQWINGVRVRALLMVEAGERIRGRKLVEKRAQRNWLPGTEFLAEKLFGDKVFEKSFLSPAQLEKQLGAEGLAFASAHTKKTSSGVTLVKETDKRPEAIPAAY